MHPKSLSSLFVSNEHTAKQIWQLKLRVKFSKFSAVHLRELSQVYLPVSSILSMIVISDH